MTIEQLIKELQKYQPKTEVYYLHEGPNTTRYISVKKVKYQDDEASVILE
jgi:hypothetical protein